MLFYDGACGKIYIATESDFPYRPSALFVMDGLIKACVEVRTRIDARLAENGRSATVMPVVDRGTEGDLSREVPERTLPEAPRSMRLTF